MVVENIKGGVQNAHSACDLPQNRKHVDNFKHFAKQKFNAADSSSQSDVQAQFLWYIEEFACTASSANVCFGNQPASFKRETFLHWRKIKFYKY